MSRRKGKFPIFRNKTFVEPAVKLIKIEAKGGGTVSNQSDAADEDATDAASPESVIPPVAQKRKKPGKRFAGPSFLDQVKNYWSVGVIVAAVFGACWQIREHYDDLEDKLRDLSREMSTLKDDTKEGFKRNDNRLEELGRNMLLLLDRTSQLLKEKKK